jgi:glucan phosphoethanolaminetransferase (alkaline phosphatase superfamily)
MMTCANIRGVQRSTARFGIKIGVNTAMASFLFTQQAQGWQQMFRRSQSGGFVSRLIAWLALGLILAVGLLVVVTVLLLSWLLIPLLMFKKRKLAKARYASRNSGQSVQGDVIEGVVTEIREDGTR